MLKLLRAIGLCLLAVGLAGPAAANVQSYNGTFTVKLGSARPESLTAAGIATINGSSGGIHVNTVAIDGGQTGGATVPVTDPEATVLLKTVIVSGTLGAGTLSGISGGPPLADRTLPILGLARVCIVTKGCTLDLHVDLTKNSGNTGVGIGGVLTLGGNGLQRISLENQPWTIGTGMLKDQTDNGDFVTKTHTGFAHGPGSATSSTALTSGVLQLIAPIQVTTIGLPGQLEKLSLFGTLRIHFAPEPGMLLLLGSGVVGLALLGRSRLGK